MEWLEVFLIVASAAAALGYVVLDHRTSIDLAERVARLEATIAEGHTDDLLQRVTALETRMDYRPAKKLVRRPDGRFASKDKS